MNLKKKMFIISKPYIPMQTIGLVLTILFSLTVFATPLVSAYLIDEVIPTGLLSKLYVGLMIFFMVSIAQPILSYSKNILFLRIAEMITLNIRQDLFKKIIFAPLTFFDKNNKGDIISRILGDGREISKFITSFFVVVIKNIVSILIIIAGMFYLSARITLLVLGIFLIFIIMNIKLSSKIRQISLKLQKNYDAMCTVISQMIDSIITVKAFSLEKKIEKKYDVVIQNSYRDNIKFESLRIMLDSATNLIIILSLTIIYGVGALFVMNNEMTLGTVMALGLYFQMLIMPVSEMLNNNISMQKAIPIFDRLFEYLELENEAMDYGQTKLRGSIEIKGLFFEYENGTVALNGVNLSIEENSFNAIIGQSGSGKSTLVKLLLGFYRPQKGAIYIGDQNIQDVGIDTLRNSIGYVSQSIELFNATVYENIVCTEQDVTQEEVIETCKLLNIHDKIMKLPEEYNSQITERVNLSGGEKQRIAIARALLKKPTILILDEPTSSLDPTNESNINEAIELISKKCTVILISHKVSTFAKADRIFEMKNGQLEKKKLPVALSKDQEEYYDLIETVL